MAITAQEFNLRQLLVTYRYYIPGGLALIVAAALVLFNFYGVTSIIEAHAQIEDVSDDLLATNNKLARLEELSAGELENMRRQVYTALPSEKPVFEVLSAVQGVAAETGVRVVDLSSRPGSLATASARVNSAGGRVTKESKATSTQDYETLNVTLELSGPFEALNDFFLGLVKLAPLMDLETVRISSQGGDDSVNNFAGEIDLLVYWSPTTNTPSGTGSVVELTNEQREIFRQIEELAVYQSSNSARVNN